MLAPLSPQNVQCERSPHQQPRALSKGTSGTTRPARVELLCYPSVLGYTFNPLSVYFCRDDAGKIIAWVAIQREALAAT